MSAENDQVLLDPFHLITPNKLERIEFTVMPLDLAEIANETIQVLCEKMAEHENELNMALITLAQCVNANDLDEVRVKALEMLYRYTFNLSTQRYERTVANG